MFACHPRDSFAGQTSIILVLIINGLWLHRFCSFAALASTFKMIVRSQFCSIAVYVGIRSEAQRLYMICAIILHLDSRVWFSRLCCLPLVCAALLLLYWAWTRSFSVVVPFKAWSAGVSLTIDSSTRFSCGLVVSFLLVPFVVFCATYWIPLLHFRSTPSLIGCWFACSFGAVDALVHFPSKWTRAFPSAWSASQRSI